MRRASEFVRGRARLPRRYWTKWLCREPNIPLNPAGRAARPSASMLITSEAGGVLRVEPGERRARARHVDGGCGRGDRGAGVRSVPGARRGARGPRRGADPGARLRRARAAAVVAAGRSRALTASSERWSVPPTLVEGAPVDGAGLAGIHVVGACGRSRLLVEGDRVHGRVVEGARRVSSASPTSGAGSRTARAPAGRGGARGPRGSRRAPRPARASRSTTSFAPGSTCATSSTGTALSTPPATPSSAASASSGRRRGPDPRQHRHRGPQRPWRLVHARPRRRPGRAGGRVETRRLHNRRQNEATEYGSAFARALELVVGDARNVLVSGTAAIDDHGATVHAGDFERQVRHTLEAVEALLDGAARLSRPRQATVFLEARGRRPGASSGSWPLRARRCAARDDGGRRCREDLLFEIDATAVVPVARRERE